MTVADLQPGDRLVLEVVSSILDPLDERDVMVIARVPDSSGRTVVFSIEAAAEVAP